MLVLPMRSQDPSPSRPTSRESYSTTLPARHRSRSPQTSQLRRQLAGAMLSVMPQTSPSAAKRPKLSLQTSIAPPNLATSTATESPTVRNTQANTFDAPPPTPSSAIQPQIHFPSSLAPSSATHSPYSHDAPYFLPIGTHSILRNSPLPKRHLSATSARGRRMFPPVKRVSFQEALVEVAPTPVIEDPSDDESDPPSTEEEHQRRREAIEAEDGHARTTHGKRKRRRDWVWRPMEDDILTSHSSGHLDDGVERPASQVPATDEIEKAGTDAGTTSEPEGRSSTGDASSSQGSKGPEIL